MSSGYLTNLADVARKAGLKVVEVEGWRSRGHGSFRGVKTICCHHTAGPASGNMPSLRIVTDGRAGLAGPLCNYGLGRDGTVYVVAAGYGWHAGVVRDQYYANDYAIGIEAEATGLVGWPSIQMDAYAQLCAALCDAFDLSPDRVLGHKEVCAPRGRKSDPNFDMDQFRTRVRNAPGLDHEEDRMAAFTQLDLEKAAQKGAEKALNALRFEDPDDPGKEINLQTALRRLLKDGNPA